VFPVRVSVVTYNLWGTERWPEREPALRSFCRLFIPDVLCVQELEPETRAVLDDELPTHDRVEDSFAGWAHCSNVWWNRALFESVAHGAEDVAIAREPDRRLFWVRLKVLDRDQTLFVGTVHFTDQGTPEELGQGRSTRVAETNQTIAALRRLVGAAEPAMLVGDFNDALLPLGPLFAAGYKSCFGVLGQLPPPTMPSGISRFPPGFATAFVLDWIVANQHARAVSAASPHVYAAEVPPSDHWPVQAVYELG
jgi:endonuclease/exonuclease/phosphatase family metal-dependent hydrolase